MVLLNIADISNPYATNPRCDFRSKYRTIDGTCNNIPDPWLGAAKTPLQRLTHNTYEDGNHNFLHI